MKYAPGDIIIPTSEPVVYAVNGRNKGKICDRCLKNCDGLKRCSKCRFLWYCSVNCQRDDWREFHRHECPIIDLLLKRTLEITSSIQNLVRMCIKYQYSSSVFQRSLTLHDNQQRVVGDSCSMSETFYAGLGDILNHFGIVVDHNTVKQRFGQLMRNSLGITNDLLLLKRRDPMVAGGLYVEAPVFDHSCRPNALCVFNGPVLTVRALRDIDTDKEKLTICYLEGTLMLSRAIRKEQLRKFGHFDCQCSVCIDPKYSDEPYVEFASLATRLFMALAEHNTDETNIGIFGRMFQLIQIVLGRYSKPWIETMLLFMEFTCQRIRKYKRPPLQDLSGIQSIIEYNELQSYLRKTHGTEHPLYKVCQQFGKIICPSNTLHISGNIENPEFNLC